jgi:hypothetical protein
MRYQSPVKVACHKLTEPGDGMAWRPSLREMSKAYLDIQRERQEAAPHDGSESRRGEEGDHMGYI